MGTSNAYGGPAGGTPLIPTWLDEGDGANGDRGNARNGPPDGEAPPERPIPLPAPDDRFTAARGSFSRFARSGGEDRANLGRAISHYVSRSTGGAGTAAQRMGSSRSAGARLFGFLSDVQAHGARGALQAFSLEHLAGRPIAEVFLGLADYVCPEGGTVDEGIVRDAFIEMITDVTRMGVTDLDTLTVEQMQTVFELFATRAIEARICNDIGTKAITFPLDAQTAIRVQAQLHDFIRRGVADALALARATTAVVTSAQALGFVTGVYQSAFEILRELGDAAGRQ